MPESASSRATCALTAGCCVVTLLAFRNVPPTVIASSQFTEADFFIRYLAQKAGIGVVVLSEPGERPDPDKINLVYCKDAFAAGDLFLADLKAARADWPAA
jgi:hypothetical protein